MLDAGFAIACRSCGAPSAPDAGRCSHCGAEERYDAATRARLVAHRARMRRALQQLRAIVTPGVCEGLTANRAIWTAFLLLLLPIPLIFVGISLPLALASLAGFRVGRLEPLLYLGAFAALGGGFIGLAAGLAIPYLVLKRHAERVRRRARDIVLRMEATTPVVCPACGGHASVVALGSDEPCPCPWCSTRLLPSASTEEAVRAAAQSLLAHHERAAQRVLDKLGRPPVAPRRGPRWSLPGFELTAGGAVVKGSIAGVPVRAFNEVFEGVFVFRLEVAADTGLDGEVFLVRPVVEQAMRNVTREWGYALPERTCPGPRAGWRAYAADAQVPAGPGFVALLDKLGPSDALLLDPAGLSLWRKGFGLSRSWGLVEEHHETVAALARVLQNGR